MGQRIDLDVEEITQARAYLVKPISYAGRRWVDENISPRSPRHKNGALICEPDQFMTIYEEASAEGLVVC